MSNQTNNNTIRLQEQAISYCKKGWSVIPVGQNKKPLITWKQYQSERADETQINEWFKTYPNMNIGLVTGKVSGIAVIDIDPRHGGTNDAFNDIRTISVKTGGGGYHYYFKYENDIQNAANIQSGIDIRGEGGYVIAPPSDHPSGGVYEWIAVPDRTELADIPDFVLEWIKKPQVYSKETNTEDTSYLHGVSEGGRNDAASRVAGVLLQKFPVTEWEDKVWPLLRAWNKSNKPPLDEKELRDVYDSIKVREAENGGGQGGRPSMAEEAVQAILASDVKLFHDQYKKGYISLTGDGREVFSFKSEYFKKWIARFIWTEFSKPASSETINKIALILDSNATFDGDKHHLEVRMCEHENAYWYDIGDGSAVRIDEMGYALVQEPPIIFSRQGHQEEQVIPKAGGDLRELTDFVNIHSEKEKLLFMVFTVASFIPGYPHPLLVLHGPQGAGKSTPLRMLKMLIDPSQLKTLTMSDNMREFIQLASHHYFLFFDNLSGLPLWMSDALARASTGDGFSKRELYTDDSDIIYSFQRTIGLNGINLVVEKADLLDRSILLGLRRIPKNKRMEEKEFWGKFKDRRPYILGSIFHTVSKAISIYPNIKLDEYPRMADFCRWGCAIAEAIGYTAKDFTDAYYANINSQNDAALDASPVGTAVVAFMNDKKENWEGSASELLEILEKYAEKEKINMRQKLWPKDAAWVVKRLNTIVPNLEEAGIKYERLETHRPKLIRLTRLTQTTDATDVPSEVNQTDLSDSDKVDDGSDGKTTEVESTDNTNGLSSKPASVMTVPTVNTDKQFSIEDMEKIKSREECSDMTDVEYDIYLEKAWNTTEKEVEMLAQQKVNSSPPRK